MTCTEDEYFIAPEPDEQYTLILCSDTDAAMQRHTEQEIEKILEISVHFALCGVVE